MKINWTHKADARIDEILDFYKEKSPKVAKEILVDINKTVEPLVKFPQMAAIEPVLSDLPISFRSLIVRNIYKIIYYVDENNGTINIVTVWDCRQNPKNLKDEVIRK
ncbi:type II toxin-antitoxin system RelE/ParE family toxin [Dysgonomonas reticulitermitis]